MGPAETFPKAKQPFIRPQAIRRSSVEVGGDEEIRRVLELTAAHLAELSVLRLFGADRVALELERLAVHCEASDNTCTVAHAPGPAV